LSSLCFSLLPPSASSSSTLSLHDALPILVLSEVGGLAGIVLGVAGGNIIALLLDISMVFPWGWALTGLIVCSMIGMGFGWYPAWKAARLHPIDALRYE